jgi:undecaprenyl-diphosphatase
MSFVHAILFAILQGATELFPVSSLGHAVVVPAVLKWGIDEASPGFLPFLVMLHLGTAAGLLAFFWRDWWAMLLALLGQGTAASVRQDRGLLARLIVATLPAVIIGLVLAKPIAALFASPLLVCLLLIANAGVLLAGEALRRQGGRALVITYKDALIIGLCQCLAFLPGISRSGAAIVGALRRGIGHEAAAKFSFLMGTPIILAASIKEVPKLIHNHQLHALLGPALIAAIVAGAVAFASTAVLMRYFRDHEAWALRPFAFYCAGFGAICFITLLAGY